MEAQSSPARNPQLSRLVRWKVSRLRRKWNLTRFDAEVLEHDLEVHLELAEESYDETQGRRSTFHDRVIDRWLNSYLRHRFAAKRSPRREECSLNERVRDGCGRLVERHVIIVEASVDSQRIHDMRRDIETLRQLLPSDHHRNYLDAKARGGTTNSIAIELGICRPRVELIELEVREVAITIGLGEYLIQ